jgi:hypothetical protein
MASKSVTVHEVVYQVADDHPAAHGGPAGDGSFTYRSRRKTDVETFAKGQTYYGKPATVSKVDVPRRTAERWGCA